VIEVNGLVKMYGERKVLHELDFTVGKSQVCGFLGPNGSGKSTTMDILAGLLGPSAGTVKVCGYDVISQARDVKAIVGYLPDNPPLYKEMYVRDFIYYVAKLHGIKASKRASAVSQVMEECDVTEVSNRIIGNLSKGFRQRVGLCAALVHKPEVLILDEPTEGLDPNQILHIRNLIKQLARNKTVILSSHILPEVQATCSHAIIINKGHIAARTSLIEKTGDSQGTYLYSFADKAKEAASWLENSGFVEKIKMPKNEKHGVLVSFNENFWGKKQPDALGKVTSELVNNGFPIIGLEKQHSGVEELFFNAIREE